MLIIIHKKTIAWKVTVKKIFATMCSKTTGWSKNEKIQELLEFSIW